MYWIYSLYSLSIDLSRELVLWAATFCIHKHMSQSHESPTCLHLTDQHCLVSESPGGCTTRITHPWRDLCHLFNSYVEILTYSNYLFWGWHIRMCSLTIIKPYDFVPSILENGASRGCKGQVMHPRKALFALSPNYHKLLADYKCFVLLWGNHLIFINIYLPHKPHMLSSLFMEYVGQWQPLRVHK